MANFWRSLHLHIHMKKIEVFIIGAQKAGTTSLYAWLGQHPEISAPIELKDYHFVTHEEKFEKGWAYLESFYHSEKLKVHAAVNYMYYSKMAAERIYQYNPDAKIVICLRNPVERAISAFKYCIRNLSENETNFANAIERELEGNLIAEEEGDLAYLKHGNYVEQINDYLKYYPKENIHYLLFEDVIKDQSTKELNGLFDFFSISKNVEIDFTHQNKSGKVKSGFLNYVLRKDYPLKGVRKLIPFKYRKRWGSLMRENNISTEEIDVSITNKDKQRLIDYYKEMIVEMESIINRKLGNKWCYEIDENTH